MRASVLFLVQSAVTCIWLSDSVSNLIGYALLGCSSNACVEPHCQSQGEAFQLQASALPCMGWQQMMNTTES